MYNLRHAELEIYWCQGQCPAGWAGDTGLPGGDGRYKGGRRIKLFMQHSQARQTSSLTAEHPSQLIFFDGAGGSQAQQEKELQPLEGEAISCFIFLMLFTNMWLEN